MHVRLIRRALVAGALLTAASAVALPVASAGPAQQTFEDAELTIAPNTGLADNQKVTLTYAGFPANGTMLAIQCDERQAPGAPLSSVEAADCTTPGQPPSVISKANAQGAGTIEFEVQTGTIGDGTCDDGSHNSCSISVLNVTGTVITAANRPITFGAPATTTTTTATTTTVASTTTTTTTAAGASATTTTAAGASTTTSTTAAASSLADTGVDAPETAAMALIVGWVGFVLVEAARRKKFDLR